MSATSRHHVYLRRRVKSFALAMRRLEARGMLAWGKGPVAHACHAEVNAGRGEVADRWMRSSYADHLRHKQLRRLRRSGDGGRA